MNMRSPIMQFYLRRGITPPITDSRDGFDFFYDRLATNKGIKVGDTILDEDGGSEFVVVELVGDQQVLGSNVFNEIAMFYCAELSVDRGQVFYKQPPVALVDNVVNYYVVRHSPRGLHVIRAKKVGFDWVTDAGLRFPIEFTDTLL